MHDPSSGRFFAAVCGLALVPSVLTAAPLASGGRTDLHGDPLPPKAVARLGTVRWRHTGPVYVLGFVAAGKQLVTFSENDGILVWDAATGTEVRRFGTARDPQTGAETSPKCVSLCCDGRTLLEGRTDGSVRTWDVTTGKELRRFEVHLAPGVKKPERWGRFGPPWPHAAEQGWALAPDGKTLVVKGPGRLVRILDGQTGKELRQLEAPRQPPAVKIGIHDEAPEILWESPNLVAFLPDGQTFLSVDGEYGRVEKQPGGGTWREIVGLMTFWDARTGKMLRQVVSPSTNTRAFAFAPDGKTFALAVEETFERNWVGVYDAGTGKLRRKLDGVFPRIAAVAYSPDGKLLAGRIGNQAVYLWDLSTGARKQLLGPQADPNYNARIDGFDGKRLAFSPDGRTLAAGMDGGTIRLWDVATGREREGVPGHHGPISSLAVSRDGQIVTLGTDNCIHRWDPDGKERSRVRLPGDAFRMPLSADGRFAGTEHFVCAPDLLRPVVEWLVGDSSGYVLCLWDTATGHRLPGPWKLANSGTFAFSPDGRILAWRSTWEEAPILRRWDTATGCEMATIVDAGEQPRPKVDSGWRAGNPLLVFAPDGRTAATSSIWRRPNGEKEGRPGGVVSLWDMVSCRRTFQFAVHEVHGPSDLVFSPDARTVATADGHVELWEAATGKKRAHFKNAGWRLAYSPDDRTLAVGNGDGTIRLWDARTGQELGRLGGHRGLIRCLTWTPDGRALVAAGTETSALVWDVSELLPRPRPRPAALTEKEVDKIWLELADEDAATAFRAITALAAVPDQALPWLRRHVRPAPGIGAQQTAQLIADLDHAEFAVREKATRELEKLDFAAEPALRHALAKPPSPEVRRRVQAVLAKLGTRVPSGEEMRPLRAVEVLEQIGTPEVRQVLQGLADGAPDARLTQQAQNALRRLAGNAAPPLAPARGGP
jgi:WD40 repeat protein